MASVAQFLRTNHDEILNSWTQEAQTAASAKGLDRPELQNIFPSYLAALADSIEQGKTDGARTALIRNHMGSRLRQGFQLAEVTEELSLLGRCIVQQWLNSGQQPPISEAARLFELLQGDSATITEMFTKHMARDEQTEKRYLRLIQNIARKTPTTEDSSFRAQLRKALELVMEALGAQTAALLLYEPKTQELVMAASTGMADEHLQRYATSLSLDSFAGSVAAYKQSTTPVWDVAVTELEVSEVLRTSGIHSLLGVRLPSHHTLVGVMYVGLTETRSFTAGESARLESLGERLTLQIDNAQLHAKLTGQIAELEEERGVRERFVSILAHDLRGPLSAAKMSAQLLIRHPDKLDERRELAAKIDSNIERTDRMIGDLLDANRIRAGEQIPLRIESCNLASIAREVADELNTNHGERLLVEAPEHLVGFWSREEMRRALWNLATNAIKYGDPEKPITITTKQTESRALIAVHNFGTPIPPSEQERLFDAFSRTQSARKGSARGWGLGLALVRGCANAHGGSVTIESTERRGTTFTIDVPLDSRPFQHQGPLVSSADSGAEHASMKH
jgi:signal transduction histidine kinase